MIDTIFSADIYCLSLPGTCFCEGSRTMPREAIQSVVDFTRFKGQLVHPGRLSRRFLPLSVLAHECFAQSPRTPEPGKTFIPKLGQAPNLPTWRPISSTSDGAWLR